MVEGGVDFLDNLAGDIVDSTDASDAPPEGGDLAR
jgi:hypothetical protein